MAKRFFHHFCPSDIQSKYSLIVFDDNKAPFIPLTEYYHWQIGRVSDSTALSYLNALEVFFYWLKHKSLHLGERITWDKETYLIKTAIKQYLQKEFQCKVRDQEKYERVYLTNKSNKTVNHFLAAIKGFYKCMISLKLYHHKNPLVSLEVEQDIREDLGIRKNKPRMPQIAGTEEPKSFRKQTESYFKIVNHEWVPEIIGDLDLPYIIYNAGEKMKWSLRDEVIIRFMFETGARISEILGLTIGDYRNRTDKHELSAFNKGSYKRRSKFLKISPDTLKLLIRYINVERNQYTNNPNNFKNLENNEQIFISQRGTVYSYNSFYNNWTKITKSVDIKLNPHKARHWFVTSMLRGIYEMSNSSAEIEERKKQLIEYMKWRDADTINVYEHYYDEDRYRDLHDKLIQNYLHREKEYLKSKTKNQINQKSTDEFITKQNNNFDDEWLNEFYEGMEDE
ncbi:tyrosine-type recombinase/integrase [Chengkuizengella marina]|uniref:Site-specific integrase n=1 Tax=Chengkuizengella marina TaxID=2507566 RepID=A0A6N9Q8F2_9BACL|nr:site-specific integrase [Chengkuizengella marina]NBI30894.1 site-specific integrase [Chengkuizengella marina]